MADSNGEKKAPNINERLSFIRALSELTEVEKTDLKENTSGYLLSIDADRVFDLHEWYHTPSRTNNRYPARDKRQDQSLTDDIGEVGVLVPPILDQDTGEVVDGRHRLQALYQHRAGKKECQFRGFELRKFASLSDMHDFQDRIALQSRRLNRKQMAEIIQAAIKRHSDWADNRIGNLLNVDGDTVKRHRDILLYAGEAVNSDSRIGADGRRTKARKTKTAKSKDSQEKLLEGWFLKYGIYPVTVDHIAELMAELKLDFRGKKGKPISVIRALARLATNKVTYKSFQVYCRELTKNLIVFGLVPLKLQRLELEAGSADSEEGASTNS